MFFNVFTYLNLKHLLTEPTGYGCVFAHKPMDYLSIVGWQCFRLYGQDSTSWQFIIGERYFNEYRDEVAKCPVLVKYHEP